ncbi:rho GTPase-activating protein 25-like [Rhinoraja longicauda]
MSLKLPRNVWDFNLKTDSARIGRSKSVMPGEHSSNRPSSPNTLDRPVKSGWLKKKRSLVKQWQSRWFVLRGFYLSYYKEEEEGKPQGCIVLQDCKVNERPANPEDPGKFLFEIVPGSGDRDRMGNVQDSHMLMANSQSEMEEWVKAIRRTMGSLSTGGVFGQRLSDMIGYEQKFGQHLVPIIVEKCADFMREQGLKEEGIFRLPGQDNLVKELRDAFDAGERPSFNRDTDVHTVASLFKLYFRELPEPVIPWSQYEDFLACSQMLDSSNKLGQQELMKQISLLPQENYNLLGYICRFLHEVQLHSAINKMSVGNLATVIGVNLFRPKIEDPAAIMRGAPQIQKLMTVMISNHDELFPKHKDKPPSPSKSDSKKASVQRSMVGWGASEIDTGFTTDDYRSGQVDEIGFTLESDFDRLNGCPRKRTHTLPASSCILSSAGEMSHSVVAGSSGADVFDKRKSYQENLTEGHKRSHSQDMMKTPTHDTLTQPDDSQRKDSVSSGWPPEQSTLPSVELGSPGNPCLKVSQHLSSNTQKDQPKLERKEEKAELDVSEMSMEQLRSQLITLRQELNEQKQSYEERIESVLTENYEVWAKVVRLNQQMEEDKKRYEAMEVKLCDTTRALQEAEKRKLVLEKELQAKNKASA